MTHGTGFLAKYSSFEIVIAGLDPRMDAGFGMWTRLKSQKATRTLSRWKWW